MPAHEKNWGHDSFFFISNFADENSVEFRPYNSIPTVNFKLEDQWYFICEVFLFPSRSSSAV